MDPATYGEGNHGSQIMPKAHGRLGYGSNQREDGADVVGTSNNYDRPISLIHTHRAKQKWLVKINATWIWSLSTGSQTAQSLRVHKKNVVDMLM